MHQIFLILAAIVAMAKAADVANPNIVTEESRIIKNSTQADSNFIAGPGIIKNGTQTDGGIITGKAGIIENGTQADSNFIGGPGIIENGTTADSGIISNASYPVPEIIADLSGLITPEIIKNGTQAVNPYLGAHEQKLWFMKTETGNSTWTSQDPKVEPKVGNGTWSQSGAPGAPQTIDPKGEPATGGAAPQPANAVDGVDRAAQNPNIIHPADN